MKTHDGPEDVARPLADLSQQIPPNDDCPPLPVIARADELMTPWVLGSTYRTAFRREWIRDKVTRNSMAGENPDAGFVLTGDKAIMLSDNQHAFLMFGVAGSKREAKPTDQVTNGSGLKDDCVLTRIEFLAIYTLQALGRRDFSSRFAIDVFEAY